MEGSLLSTLALKNNKGLHHLTGFIIFMFIRWKFRIASDLKITVMGYKNIFCTMAGIDVGVMLLGVPLWRDVLAGSWKLIDQLAKVGYHSSVVFCLIQNQMCLSY